MLRSRSRTLTGKQATMADQSSMPSPTSNRTIPPMISSFFGSPKFFNGFLAKGHLFSDAEAIISPTSILDNKNISSFGNNPFVHDKTLPKAPTSLTKHPFEKLDTKAIGLALIDSLKDDNHTKSDDFFKPNGRKILFGSKLKVQIPTLLSPSPNSPSGSPKSPGDFGIKTRNSQFLAPNSSSTCESVTDSCIQTKDSPRPSACLSLSEMELSEEYTCVISRGPNPKTTHIYDNCIVENSSDFVGSSPLKKDNNLRSPSPNFLSFCYTCKKNLGNGSDIYMYRGEKAFCSNECRSQEMLFDESEELGNG